MHIQTLFIFICGLISISLGDVLAAPARPNILFILADDLGYGDVGWTHQNLRTQKGLPAIRTPQLDQLAKEGVQFTDHYSGCPVCAPSRASLLNGQTQGHCSLRDNCFDQALANRITLGTIMKQAGYATYAVGKWGLAGGGESGTPRTSHPLDSGFDHFYGFLDHIAGHTYYHYDYTISQGAYMGIFEDRNKATEGAIGRYSTDLFTARAKKYIIDHVKATPQKPFFMYYAVNAVHGSGLSDNTLKVKHSLHVPGRPYPKGAGLHGGVQWPLAAEPLEARNTWIDPQYQDLLKLPNGDMRARYATTITRMDTALADLFQLLKDLKIDKNTLVIFTSDNGPAEERGASPKYFESAGCLDGMKRTVYEGGFREPAFAYWPGTLKSQKISTPSGFWDWMPTFAELAGLPAPAASDGRSLLPDLQGKKSSIPSTIYVEYNGGIGGGKNSYARALLKRKNPINVGGQQQMIRMGDFVALRSQSKNPESKLRLYNVVQDPHQDHDLASDPNYADRLQMMSDALIQNRIPSKKFRRPYDEKPIPALRGKAKTKGVQISVYPLPSQKLYLPDYRKTPDVKPIQIEKEKNLKIKRSADKSYVITGKINVPETGTYTFSASGEGAAHLFLHQARALAKENQEKPITQTLPMEKGIHPVTILSAGPVQIQCKELGLDVQFE